MHAVITDGTSRIQDVMTGGQAAPLYPRLMGALRAGESATAALDQADAHDPMDRFLSLLAIYDLSTAPLAETGDGARWAGAPAVVALKQRLESAWMAELDAVPIPDPTPITLERGMRALAARDRLPRAYRWLADEADWTEVVQFLAIEGGPDGGFDDLVAVCQVGLPVVAKRELARNYWDEMGAGDGSRVHTTLHASMAAAIDMPRIARTQQPAAALARVALGGLLATNHWLQPEMVGALGLIELQAGPRCRMVLRAFDRLGAPRDAYPFYAEHAEVDPRHGRDWLHNAVLPLSAHHPEWAARMLRGAWWRSQTNRALFDILPSLVSGGAGRARVA